MSLLSRLTNMFRRDRLDRELAEELADHLDEAAGHGRSAVEARRALGSSLQYREHSRDLKLIPWLDSLLADAVFAWRQMRKRPAASAAAVLSLGLAIGATTAVYRLVEPLLLRKLPIPEPDRYFSVATTYIDRDGKPDWRDDYDYPSYRRYRDAAVSVADVMVIGRYSNRAVVQIGQESETARRQFFSGNVFPAFGLRPAIGRFFSPEEDRVPGAIPVAVISHDYWTRRFGGDPAVLGRPFRLGGDRYEIIGVAPKGFTGTEPGNVTDLFLPAMMNAQAINSPGWSWFRIWVRPKDGITPEQVRQTLEASFIHDRDERMKTLHSDTPRQVIQNILSERLLLLPAANGASELQKEYRRPLWILGILVALVLLVACANVGNLLTAQAAARSREMALRVSIGAGRSRLVQLILVESAMLAALGSAVGVVFAWQAAPWIVTLLRVPQDPVQFIFDAGWRTWLFTGSLALVVTLLFGLPPALRAGSVQPMGALKGGDDPHARRRMMHVLLAAQMAFCILVQFVAGLFVTTFYRLANRPLGFSHERILVLSSSAASKERPVEEWMQVADHLRQTPGVESVSLAGWPLVSGNRWTVSVRVAGHPVEARPPYALDVSPGFFETMRIARIEGRDFRFGDRPPRFVDGNAVPGIGIVNEAFARVYFDGRSPVGRTVDLLVGKDQAAGMEIVGMVKDVAYGNLRETIRPTVFVPQAPRNSNSLIIRTAGSPKPMAPLLRAKVVEARSDYRVRTIEYQTEYVKFYLLRERVLAALSLFFAAVALVLAAVGLYGVLNYSVTRQRREIGIRMALGARATHVVRRVTARSVAIVTAGLSLGLLAGVLASRAIQSLLYEVKPTDGEAIALPALTLIVAAIVAAVPPAIRAVRIDPARTLRSE